MIELAFTVCLMTAPDVCENRSLVFIDVPQERCVMGAQPQLARWAAEHEGWRIARWSCNAVDPGQHDI